MTTQHRKIDPMGVLGKIFASVGVGLVVIGVLLAVLLGRYASGGFGFSFVTLAGAWGTGLLFLLLGLVFLLFFRNIDYSVTNFIPLPIAHINPLSKAPDRPFRDRATSCH